MKIGVLDDDSRKRNSFEEKIKAVVPKEFSIIKIEPGVIKEIFSELLERQSEFRTKGTWRNYKTTEFDDLDILIVDNELRDFFKETGIFTSADEVAYMARCFSKCKMIIIVNRTSYAPFDLTGNLSYLGQFEAFSDLEIGEDQIGSKVLWLEGEREEFNPWYWFVLPKWIRNFERCIQDVKDALHDNRPILEFFGIEKQKDYLSTRILQTLGDANEYTFGEFLRTRSFVLWPKDREILIKSETLEPEMIEVLAPVVAARLWKWLEFQLLPELDVLIDAPHLAYRFPSLIEGDSKKIETWNAIAVRHVDEVPNLKQSWLENAKFIRPHWLTRPVWYWHEVSNNQDIPDVSKPWEINEAPFVFCEDISQFSIREKSRRYRANVDSPFSLRFIRKLQGIDYIPPQRLAL